jgi:FtsZ-interacting cell division protein ZipA
VYGRNVNNIYGLLFIFYYIWTAMKDRNIVIGLFIAAVLFAMWTSSKSDSTAAAAEAARARNKAAVGAAAEAARNNAAETAAAAEAARNNAAETAAAAEAARNNAAKAAADKEAADKAAINAKATAAIKEHIRDTAAKAAKTAAEAMAKLAKATKAAGTAGGNGSLPTHILKPINPGFVPSMPFNAFGDNPGFVSKKYRGLYT